MRRAGRLRVVLPSGAVQRLRRVVGQDIVPQHQREQRREVGSRRRWSPVRQVRRAEAQSHLPGLVATVVEQL